MTLSNRFAPLAIVLCFAFPWIYPFAPPPSVHVTPLLVAGYSLALIFLMAVIGRIDKTVIFRCAAWAWLFAGLFNAVVVITQYLGVYPPQLPGELHIWVIPTSIGSAFGQLRQRNHAASLFCMALIALIYLSHTTRPSLNRSSRLQITPIITITALLLGMACAATGSRTGLVQLTLIVVLAGYFSRSLVSLRAPVIGAALGYLLGSWGLSSLLHMAHPGLSAASTTTFERLAEHGGCDNRLLLWRNVLELISRQPWTGWGFDNLAYAHYMSTYTWGPLNNPSEHQCGLLDNAHNLFLHIAVEGGIPLTVAVIGLLIWGIYKGKPWRENNPQRLLAWGVLTLIFMHSMLEYPLWYGHFFAVSALCVWRLMMTEVRPVFASKGRMENRRNALAFLAMAITLALNYVQYDYNRVSQIFKSALDRSAWYMDDPYGHAESTFLFERYVTFAQLLRHPLTTDNAPQMFARAQALLHTLPEHRVVARLIESAEILGKPDVAVLHTALFKVAYPKEFAVWQDSRPNTTPKKLPLMPTKSASRVVD